MSVKYDQHVHSDFSGDAEAKMEDLIKEAIDKGMEGITFTEHNDIDFPYSEGEEKMFDLNTDSYLYELLCMREKYEDKIKIGFGVELGMQMSSKVKNEEYAASFPFDMIIFSCHIVDGVDPYYPEPYWKDKNEKEAIGEYFKCILENIKHFDNYDVLGHLDYIVRYAPNKDNGYSYEKYKDLIDEILTILVKKGKGLEINTSGYMLSGLKDVHPCNDILKRYRELGGKIITIGSDTHRTGMIGGGFDKAKEALTEAGFDYYCSYEKRVAHIHKL